MSERYRNSSASRDPLQSVHGRIALEFLRSALARDSAVMPTDGILGFLARRNREVSTRVRVVPLKDLRQWRFAEETGDLVHVGGHFFTIHGVRVSTDWGPVGSWDQPIINQSEIGILGILAKKIDGVLHFLMQAKIEPGNVNVVQVSPTLQATRSNYSRVHQGKRPAFLEYFNGERPVRVLLDQLQSEQGARFLRKRNRNIIVEVASDEALEAPDDFFWATLGQIKALLRHDNVVNMDTRSVISGIPFVPYDSGSLDCLPAPGDGGALQDHLMKSSLDGCDSLHGFEQIMSWITGLKSTHDLQVSRIPLRAVRDWENDGVAIRHRSGRYFTVIGVDAQIDSREVIRWDQPMIQPAQEGLVAFLTKKIHGIHHFLVQAKLEPGNMDIIELAPTVQCLTGNYRTGQNEYSVPFINEVLAAGPDRAWYSALQSEEGGRFYREQNRNMIVEVGDDFGVEVPGHYCWMTLRQLQTLILFNNFLNIAARSLIAAVAI